MFFFIIYILLLIFVAYSTVYLCSHISENRLVIIKQIPVEQMTKEERLAAVNEVKVLSMMNHPYIIEYYENFLEDKALMIVMEYAQGDSTCFYKLMIPRHKNKYILKWCRMIPPQTVTKRCYYFMVWDCNYKTCTYTYNICFRTCWRENNFCKNSRISHMTFRISACNHISKMRIGLWS